MRLLVWLPCGIRGGLERLTTVMIGGLVKQGVQVHVISHRTNLTPARIDWGRGVFFTPITPAVGRISEAYVRRSDAKKAWQLRAHQVETYIKRNKIDVVWIPNMLFVFDLGVPNFGVPVVVHPHDNAMIYLDSVFAQQYIEELSQAIAINADFVWQSQYQADFAKQNFPPHVSHIMRLNGFIQSSFNPSDQEALRVQMKYSLPNTFFLTTHPSNGHKNAGEIVTAWHIAKTKLDRTIPPLVISGMQSDLMHPASTKRIDEVYGKARIAMQSAVKEANWQEGKDWYILGHIDDVDMGGLYRLAYAACSASQSEAELPGLVFEATAARTPVIVPNHPFFTERLDNSVAFVYNGGDVEDLARTLVEAWQNNRDAATRANACHSMLFSKSLDELVCEFIAIIRGAMERQKGK